MASLESIYYVPKRPEVESGQVSWIDSKAKVIDALPQLCWEDGSTWSEANLWALEQATLNCRDIKTVDRSMSHLLGYAKWLEAEGIDWWHFPVRERDRCLVKFRGALIQARGDGVLAPSTISQRMCTVVRFYRWMVAKGLLAPEWPMWTERQIGIKVTNQFGLEHTFQVASTHLSISNRSVAGAIRIEDGLLPVSLSAMRDILRLADQVSSEELGLMLRIGFQTGLRLQSILDLKLETLRNALRDPIIGWHRLAVGPAARPPVATKFGISGMVPIPNELLLQLIQYSTSTRRLKRQAKAAPKHRELLLLTRFGNSYAGDKSRAVNVEMMRLRRAGRAAGLEVLEGFHFHRTRATFATELTRAALRTLSISESLHFVREACLHKSESSTFKYIRFLESSKSMAEAADEFTVAFLGLARSTEVLHA